MIRCPRSLVLKEPSFDSSWFADFHGLHRFSRVFKDLHAFQGSFFLRPVVAFANGVLHLKKRNLYSIPVGCFFIDSYGFHRFSCDCIALYGFQGQKYRGLCSAPGTDIRGRHMGPTYGADMARRMGRMSGPPRQATGYRLQATGAGVGVGMLRGDSIF